MGRPRKYLKGAYKQIKGQPHRGLHNPSRYGLSQEEVNRLIDTKTWNKYKILWDNKQFKLDAISNKNFICPNCSKTIEDIDAWNESGELCKACTLIKKQNAVAKNREKIVSTVKVRKRDRCKSCNRFVAKTKYFCAECEELLNEIRS
jgi:hypothetical protein